MTERSLSTLKSKKKPVQKRPVNFTDLRPEARKKKTRSQLIQDIMPPSVKRQFRLWWSPSFRARTVVIGLLIVVVAAAFILSGASSNPVPAPIRKQVTFNVYYPDQSKLPVGYVLNTKSFSATPSVVLYNIDGPKDITVHVSVQKNPGENQIQTFYQTNLTLHTDITTTIGTARIGAVGDQSITSLPTTSNAWILLTAPGTIDQGQLTQVVRSLKY